jgi:hypothetical protein
MGFVHGKNSRLFIGPLNFSGYLRSHERSSELEMADSTTYGNDGHRFTPGQETGAFSAEGLMDNAATAGSQNTTLKSALKASAGSVITTGDAGISLGSGAFMIEARENSYTLSSPVADMVSFNTAWSAEGQVDEGKFLAGETVASGGVGTVDGTGVDNGASTPNGAAAHLHVTANNRNGTTTVKVQHSADGTTWVDLITFTTVVAGTTVAERRSVTGTVNRYLRAQITKAGTTGSVTVTVAAARR